MLSAEQIQSNWDKHIKIINHYIGDDRKNDVLTLVEALSDHMIMAPASSKSWYHNAFPGGYIDHVNRVVQCAIKQKELWQSMGASIDFTEEELVMAAIFHDLGKIGDGDKDCYIPQTDKWRQDKLHEMYTPNPEISFMLIPDRSLYILQRFGIKLSHNEYLGIRLHDGVFDKANEAYFFSHNPDSRMRTNIVNILHSADFMASKVEYDIWKNKGGSTEPKVQKAKSATGRPVNSSEGLSNLIKNL